MSDQLKTALTKLRGKAGVSGQLQAALNQLDTCKLAVTAHQQSHDTAQGNRDQLAPQVAQQQAQLATLEGLLATEVTALQTAKDDQLAQYQVVLALLATEFGG